MKFWGFYKKLFLIKSEFLNLIITPFHNDDIMAPANFCNQWLQFFILAVAKVESPHIPDVSGLKTLNSRKFNLKIFCQLFHYRLSPTFISLPFVNHFFNIPVQGNQFSLIATNVSLFYNCFQGISYLRVM